MQKSRPDRDQSLVVLDHLVCHLLPKAREAINNHFLSGIEHAFKCDRMKCVLFRVRSQFC